MLAKRGLMNEPTDAEVDELQAAFIREYDQTWREGTAPYPGILPLLEELHRDGLPLAVLSNKPHRFTAAIVDTLFEGIPFAAVLGQGEGVPHKPDPTGALRIADQLGIPRPRSPRSATPRWTSRRPARPACPSFW